MRVRLTSAIVRRAKPGASRAYLWDTEVQGLGLVVHPSGRQSWVFQGPASVGRRRTLKAASLDEARTVAVGIRSGVVPLDALPQGPLDVPAALTVNRLVDAWLDALAARPQPPISLLRIRACMDNHVRGRIGDVRLASLSRVHVLAIRDGVAAQGSRAMANQVVAYLRAALRWGEDARIIPEAPRWRVPRFRLGTRAHSLTDDQWARLLAALGDEGAGLHRSAAWPCSRWP
jgi:hypothetical protein